MLVHVVLLSSTVFRIDQISPYYLTIRPIVPHLYIYFFYDSLIVIFNICMNWLLIYFIIGELPSPQRNAICSTKCWFEFHCTCLQLNIIFRNFFLISFVLSLKIQMGSFALKGNGTDDMIQSQREETVGCTKHSEWKI